ncbi:MAG: hypothetical protein RMI56_04495 [Sulfolobales archaeon]|nr:hypothetical protein [Sulfolobales archaeon]
MLSLAVLVYDLRSPTRLVPLLVVFLMVPLPASLMDSAVLALSKFAATANPRLSAVETAYASTVVLNAALSVTPAALLSISLGRASWRRRAATLAVSIAIVLAVGSLVGIAGGISEEVAAEGLRRSMPAVYSLMSALAAFYAVFRYCGIEWRTRGRPRLGGLAEVSWRSALGILVLALVLASVAQVAVAAVERAASESAGGYIVEVGSLEELLENPAPYLSSGRVTVARAEWSRHLEKLLGALKAHEVEVVTPLGKYEGFVEFADVPARLRTWELYLLLQGHTIVNSWSRDRDGLTKVNYLIVERWGSTYLLAYRLVRLRVVSGDGERELYARLSTLLRFEDIPTAVDTSTEVLLSIVADGSAGAVGEGGGVVDALYVASYALLSALAAYSAFLAVGMALYRRMTRLIAKHLQ